jgi:hypothetical protein
VRVAKAMRRVDWREGDQGGVSVFDVSLEQKGESRGRTMKYALATTQYPNLLERLHAVSRSREREVGGSGGSDEAALRAGESPTKAERGSILLLAVLVSW